MSKMPFQDEELDVMREFLKNEDKYILISLKGRLSKKMKQEGKIKEEIFKKFVELGDKIKKYYELLST